MKTDTDMFQKPVMQMPQDLLLRLVEINEAIVKQNALLIQTYTLPQLMVSGERPGSWKEYK